MEKQKSIPQIRFPNFDGEWEKKKLGEVSSGVMYGMNAAAKEFDGVHKYIRITDIDENSREFCPNPLSSPDEKPDKRYKLKTGDIVFARTGASVGKSYLYKEEDGDIYFAGFLIRFTIDKANPFFVYTQTLLKPYDKWLKIMSMRSGQPGVNAEEFKTLNLSFPSLQEQQKITSFFTTVDHKISQLKRKKSLLEQYKKGVMQKIFSQEIRFKDEKGLEFPKWENKKLSEYLFVSKSKNYAGNYSKDDVLSVSGEYGIVNQIEFQGRSFAGESVLNYGEVETGDIVYTKSPLKNNPYGIIKVNKGMAGIVSTLYAVYKCKDNALGEYFDYYFQLDEKLNGYLRPLVHKGAKNDMKINNERVLIDPLKVPCRKEQQIIINFLTAIDDKIKHIQKQIEKAEVWKKGLMQQMFV